MKKMYIKKQHAGNASPPPLISKNYLFDKLLRLFGIDQPTNPSQYPSLFAFLIQKLENQIELFLLQIQTFIQNPKLKLTVKKTSNDILLVLQALHQEFKSKEFTIALQQLKNDLEIILSVLDDPLNKTIDKIHSSSIRAISATGSGIIKVVTDLMASIPFVGAFMELGKVANDTTNAVSKVTHSMNEISDSLNSFLTEVTQEYQSLKKNANQIKHVQNRIQTSQQQFQNQTPSFS